MQMWWWLLRLIYGMVCSFVESLIASLVEVVLIYGCNIVSQVVLDLFDTVNIRSDVVLRFILDRHETLLAIGMVFDGYCHILSFVLFQHSA